MSENFSSPDWYRVSEAKPKLRRDVRANRHIYLGRPWVVLSDATSGKVHRLTPAAYAMVGRFDGTASVAQVWLDAQSHMGEDAPSQEDVVKLLSQLHQADFLEGEGRPDLADQLERRDKERSQWIKKLLLNPLSSTVPLVDPDRFLARLARVMGIVPSIVWWIAALTIIASALIALPAHWPALTNRGLDGFIDLENLALIALIYPIVKAVHEIGHGLVIKSRDGEVHEMGLMFIAFYPIPYVEASASLAFPSKWARAGVAAAGVVIELVIASLAFFAWTVAEPGLIKTLLFNTMVISGVSTVLINGNPLLKFDGYHALSDVIEVPNLGKRGNAWWGEMARIYILGSRERDRVPLTRWERLWFLFYPPAAFVYRIVISMTIALYVATTYYFVGVVLAIWSLALTLIWPTIKTIKAGVTHGHVRRAGRRAVLGAGIATGAIGAGVFLVPLPHHTVVQGVVWLPDDAFVRAPVDGQIAGVTSTPGAILQKGDPVLSLASADIQAEAEMRAARLQRARAALGVASAEDRAEAVRIAAQVQDAEAAFALAEARVAALNLTADISGRFDPIAPDLMGRFLGRGDIVGHILPEGPPTLRVVVAQDLVDLIRRETGEISVRFADRLNQTHMARIVREVPAGENRLPSPVFALDGGGSFATVTGQNLQTVHQVFQFDMALETPPETAPAFGLRAFVRLTFEPKPIGARAGRALRNLFLSQFDV